nr:N-acetylglucosamine-6-phosphate deacetylase [Loigolactobacillus jiayinensis]
MTTIVTVIKHACICTGETIIADGYIRFAKTILAVGPMTDFQPLANEKVIWGQGKIIVPGFIDVHSHGGYGIDAMNATPNELIKMVQLMAKNEGITSYFCTTMTQSVDQISHAMQTIATAAQHTPLIQGIHLEGPFIAPKFKGAQPAAAIIAPDPALVANWQKQANGLIKLITYAPEITGATALETFCLQQGITLSIGHSAATRAQLKNSAATHVTHLYNAQSLAVHREPGVMGHALLEPNLTVELIMDGFHNAPDMVDLAYRLKGATRIELITDSMRAKGLGDGKSELGGQAVTVSDNEARLADGTIAGSVLRFDDAFRNSMRFTSATLLDAVKMASVNQATEFGLSQKGSLAAGKDADLNILSADYHLQATYCLGQAI